MEESLAKIRPHTSSSLPHQKRPATLLIAIESTFKDQNTDRTPTAYFAALLATLDATIQKKETSLDEGDVLPAQLYLLALVAPFVPHPVIRAQLNTLLSLSAPLFPALSQHAPPLRSQLSLYHAVFQALDRSQLDTQGIRQSFATILNLVIDPRPKVRKKAVEVIKDVLTNPPAPLLRHPYADRVAEWIKMALSEIVSGPLPKGKSSNHAISPTAETGIHVITFVRPVLSTLPSTVFPSLTSILLHLPRLGNAYLTQTSYSLLSDLFILPTEDSSTNIADQLADVLKVVLSSTPTKTDVTLSPAWVRVLGDAMLAYNVANPEGCVNEIGRVWKAVWSFLESDDQATRKATASAINALCQCFSPSFIAAATTDVSGTSTLSKIIAQVSKALDSLPYARAIPEILTIISSLIEGLSYRSGGRRSPSAAETLLTPLIQHVGELRTQKRFEYKEAADATLSTAMRVLGPEVLFKFLPLNLEPEARQDGKEPRAFLLPLLTHPHPSPLGHFVQYFLPLSERMFDLQQKAEEEGRQSEAKVWSVLVGQVWSGLVGYCYATADLPNALTASFSQLLSQLLYSQPELRPAILKALKTIVDSNVAVSSTSDGNTSSAQVSPEEATANVAFLRTHAESWLAILFNVYGSANRDSRGSVGDVITSWASIAGEEEITKAYGKVLQLLKTNLKGNESGNGRNDNISVTSTALDILILLLPYLSLVDCTALFGVVLMPEVLSPKDNAVQKRGYKLLSKLVESGKVQVDAESVLKKLDELTDGLTPAAKKDRLCLLSLLVPMIPATEMHVIPSLIPEAVLGTKEPSEKSRNAAFDLIVAMGRKMNGGGVVKRSLVDGMDEDDANDTAANIEEFMTMVAGGLAGASPHMISATITVIARLVFEFKDEISPKMHAEIFTTLLVFVSSANREIVKSALGFVKLAIHSLPIELLRPHLGTLVPALLNWSHDHKNHFKVKVRHIFERMLRRFSWEEVYSAAGGAESAKVLVNIKKRKERAKRKKANRADEEEEDETSATKPVVGDAFEDVLYGSESEISDSDDEATATHPRKPKKANDFGARLRVDDDEPMDLLQGAASRITNAAGARRRKPGQEASRFKIDDDTGKMVIDKDDDSDDNAAEHTMDVAGEAYRESLTSVDGFTRGPNGRIKFNKDTKKRRRESAEDGDVEMVDAEEMGSKKKPKRKTEVKFGQEFKAKKAGGDIKKGGVDPYAYLSLSQAAKRKGKNKIGIAGKR